MANWVYKLNLKDLWDKYRATDNANITDEQARESGEIIARRLHSLADSMPEPYQQEAHELANEFEFAQSIDDLNELMNQLWDLGDSPLPTPAGQMQRKLIWVATF